MEYIYRDLFCALAVVIDLEKETWPQFYYRPEVKSNSEHVSLNTSLYTADQLASINNSTVTLFQFFLWSTESISSFDQVVAPIADKLSDHCESTFHCRLEFKGN